MTSSAFDGVIAYERRGAWQRWFGLLGAILAWAVSFMVAYPIAEACGSRAWLVGIHLAAYAVAAVATFLAWRLWREGKALGHSTAGQRERYMGLGGLLLGGGTMLLLTAQLVIILVVPQCTSGTP